MHSWKAREQNAFSGQQGLAMSRTEVSVSLMLANVQTVEKLLAHAQSHMETTYVRLLFHNLTHTHVRPPPRSAEGRHPLAVVDQSAADRPEYPPTGPTFPTPERKKPAAGQPPGHSAPPQRLPTMQLTGPHRGMSEAEMLDYRIVAIRRLLFLQVTATRRRTLVTTADYTNSGMAA